MNKTIKIEDEWEEVKLIEIEESTLYGKIMLVTTKKAAYLAKELSSEGESQFSAILKERPFLFDSSIPFIQQFHSQRRLFGKECLVFPFHTNSLYSVLLSSIQYKSPISDASLSRLFFKCYTMITCLKGMGVVYPQLTLDICFIDNSSELKLMNPLLFEELFRLG